MAVGFATVAGAMISSQASKSAASTAASAAQRGQDVQERIYLQQREDFAPYREVGTSALEQLSSLYGLASPASMERDKLIQEKRDTLADLQRGLSLGGAKMYKTEDGQILSQYEYDQLKKVANDGSLDAVGGTLARRRARETLYGSNYRSPSAKETVTPYGGVDTTDQITSLQSEIADLEAQQEQQAQAGPDLSAFTQSPGYQFRQEEGQTAVERAAAARGGRISGNTLAALQQRGQDIASQEYGNYFNRMAALAGIGQSATNSTAQLGQAYGQSAANAMNMAGQYQAAGTLGQAQAISGGLTGLAQLYGSGSLGSSSWSAQNPSAWGTVPGSQQSQMLESQWS